METIILHNSETGRMTCRICQSMDGFYLKKYRAGVYANFTNTLKCVCCGSKEIRYSNRDEIKAQTVNKFVTA